MGAARMGAVGDIGTRGGHICADGPGLGVAAEALFPIAVTVLLAWSPYPGAYGYRRPDRSLGGASITICGSGFTRVQSVTFSLIRAVWRTVAS